MIYFEKFMQIVMGLASLWFVVGLISTYVEMANYISKPLWTREKIVSANFILFGLKFGEFECVTEFAVINWATFFSFVGCTMKVAILFGLTKLIIFLF